MKKQIVVIENFGTPAIITDGEGEVIYFENFKEAQSFIDSECQCGTAVEINSL
jgi:hypothetical protein